MHLQVRMLHIAWKIKIMYPIFTGPMIETVKSSLQHNITHLNEELLCSIEFDVSPFIG